MLIGRTKSVCPVCMKTIDAEKTTGNDGFIYMEKTCPEHGRFSSLIWEGDIGSYLRWGTSSSVSEPPVRPEAVKRGCPHDCGLCADHLRKGCCMLLELTNRCNLHCPVCFASAGDPSKANDMSIDEISAQYDFLMSHGGPFNIQLSGGEPTVRDDLQEIIRLGREKGFGFFQLNTNGIKLSEKKEYAQELKDAGLNTVFLQFDGVSDEVYITLRGKALYGTKLRAVENCESAGLGVVLVPVIAPGVNDDQVGDILDFALKNMPAVRGVHFQPISYFGRCGQERPPMPITIPRMLSLIEAQSGGIMSSKDFSGGGAENPYCSFHAGYRKLESGELKLLPKKSGSSCCCTTSDDSRLSVSRQWNGAACCESTVSERDGFDDLLEELHRSTFSVSGMIFQDAWNLDLERLRRCYICEVDTEYGMVPFCAYNLTDREGNYLYRK